MTDYFIIDTGLREEIAVEIFGSATVPDPDIDKIIDLLMLIPIELDEDGAAIFTKDDVDLVEGFLKRREHLSMWDYCPGVVFVLLMLRGALKDLHLPLTKAKNWKPLAKRFIKIMDEV